MDTIDEKIAVIGLGYVGLPIALAFSRFCENTVGFDISPGRVAELKGGHDSTREVEPETLRESSLDITSDTADLGASTFYVVTVPTPIDADKRPDLSPLESACALIGPCLSKGDVVVFESTVYPGLTEEVCGPALEKASGLRCGDDFKLGYSPERINPGDREHTVDKIVKVVAGQDPETLSRVADAYEKIIPAGIHRAPSIKVAEAAKVIENTQRDLNIALINELSLIFERLEIRTEDVLAAAGTKWNFLPFRPGLVGGHCIGVDPYYLTAKAAAVGYHPEVILAGRRINDSMGAFIGQKVIKLLIQAGRPVSDAKVGILGLTFKENVPDLRNSKVPDIITELESYGIVPLVHDPMADAEEARREFDVELQDLGALKDLDALVLAVPHEAYGSLADGGLDTVLTPGGILMDVKSKLEPAQIRSDLVYWSL